MSAPIIRRANRTWEIVFEGRVVATADDYTRALVLAVPTGWSTRTA